MNNHISYIKYIKTLTNKLTTSITVTTKRLNYLTLSLTLSLTSILPILLPATANATPSTPPDSCFAFTPDSPNVGEATITDYYDYEDDDNSNPACTREVIIPGTIGGTAVTIIGNDAFRENQLSSVTIPNSVTSIGDSAFRENQLTSATIPNSVTSIGYSAFNANMLETVTLSSNLSGLTSGTIFTNNKIQEMQIPDSVTLIDTYTFFAQSPIGAGSYYAFMNNDYSALNQYMATSWYARLFTSPGNPNNLTDTYAVESVFGMDMNSDGDMNDSIGGHLINPAHITATYKDTEGNTIAPSTTATGTGLSTYLVVDNPTNNLSLYYKAGNSYTVPTAPSIAGYTIQTTPSNIASLSAGDNQINYVYTANSNNNNGGNNGGGNNGNPNTANLTTPTSPISAFTLKPVSLTTPTGTTINSSSTVPESSLVTQDNNNQYPLGLVNFSFTTNQSSNQVVLNFETDLKPNQVVAKKYNSNTNTYNNLPTNANVSITETTIDSKHHLVLTYTIIDNGELDLDPTTGIIKDPVGLAVSNSTYDQLASTGTNNTLPIVIAISLVTIASGSWMLGRRRKSYLYFS